VSFDPSTIVDSRIAMPLNELKDICEPAPVRPPEQPRPPAGARSRSPRIARLKCPEAPKRVLEEDIERISDLLQSEDWQARNETISGLIDMIQDKPGFLVRNIRVLVFSLMGSVSAPRSALAETALTCLRELSGEFGEDMTPFFESVVTHLLTVLAAGRPAIARLAADCVSAILVNIDRNAALEFLAQDYRGKQAEVKEHVALCIDALCGDCYEPGQLLPTIGMLLLEPNDNTREHAEAALVQLSQNFDDIKRNPSLARLNAAEKQAILGVLESGSRAAPAPF
jgi:hypothetical protein